MLKIIDGDIIDVATGNIFQQVNCQASMRSGLAKTIKEKYPQVEREYMDYCARITNPIDRLGDVLRVHINPNLSIVNIFGQFTHGSAEGARHTEYAALKLAFHKIVHSGLLHGNNLVAFPYLFGCGKGGGDWLIVEELIERYFPHAVIYKLPE